jgi:cytoskeletal protein RodZ
VNDPKEEAEFEAYVSRRSRLSLRYRDLSHESPPKELDDAVLSLARAAHSLKRQGGREVYIRWMAPLAFAATVVLVFTVVLQIVIRPQMIPSGANESDGQRSSALAPASPTTPAALKSEPAPSTKELRDDQVGPDRRITAGNTVASKSALMALEEVKAAAPRPAVPPRTSSPTEAPAAAAGVLASRERMAASAPRADTGDVKLDPNAWFAQIEELRKNGQAAAADEQMKLFLVRYPDYFRTHPLPDNTR